MNIGGPEIFLIAVVLIILLGSKRVKKFAKSAGEATKELKKVKNEFSEAIGDTTTAIHKEIDHIDHVIQKPKSKQNPK